MFPEGVGVRITELGQADELCLSEWAIVQLVQDLSRIKWWRKGFLVLSWLRPLLLSSFSLSVQLLELRLWSFPALGLG